MQKLKYFGGDLVLGRGGGGRGGGRLNPSTPLAYAHVLDVRDAINNLENYLLHGVHVEYIY